MTSLCQARNTVVNAISHSHVGVLIDTQKMFKNYWGKEGGTGVCGQTQQSHWYAMET